MEVAIIDWKTIDSRFVKDELYEHINAPKWVDFSAPDDPVDDEAWFCRPSKLKKNTTHKHTHTLHTHARMGMCGYRYHGVHV